MIIVKLILGILFGFLAISTLYNLVFAIAALFGKRASYTSDELKRRFVILIPAYKENNIILDTVRAALHQDYPKDRFEVVVIADQLSEAILQELSLLPVKLIQVSFDKSTKAKSIKFALQQLKEESYQEVLILDADNLLGKGCLEKANHAFSKGFKMIQLHRTAKNKNTATAILDAISEEIGNTIHRKGRRALGLSATLIGSGMAFDYALFKSVMMDTDIEDDPAEDRAINAELLRRGFTCEYIDNALVYDEKVQSNQVLERQRVRWISAQMSYVKKFWFDNPLKTLSINANYTDYALQTLIMPRSLLVVVSFGLMVLSLLLLWVARVSLFPDTLYWIVLFIACMLTLVISIGKNITRQEIRKALFYFPLTFWSFMKALFKSSSKQQDFIHTPKEYVKDESSSDKGLILKD